MPDKKLNRTHKIIYRSESGLDVVLCSDMVWRHTGFNEGANFNDHEVDYLLDRWNQNGAIDINKIELLNG